MTFGSGTIEGSSSSVGLYLANSGTLSGSISFASGAIGGKNAYGAEYAGGSGNISGVSFSTDSIKGITESAGILISSGTNNTINGLTFTNSGTISGSKSYGIIVNGGTTTTTNNSAIFSSESIKGSTLSSALHFRGKDGVITLDSNSFANNSIAGDNAYLISLENGAQGTINGITDLQGTLFHQDGQSLEKTQGAIYVQTNPSSTQATLSTLTFSNLKGSSTNDKLKTIGITLESGAIADLSRITFNPNSLNGATAVGIYVKEGGNQSSLILGAQTFGEESFGGSKDVEAIRSDGGRVALEGIAPMTIKGSSTSTGIHLMKGTSNLAFKDKGDVETFKQFAPTIYGLRYENDAHLTLNSQTKKVKFIQEGNKASYGIYTSGTSSLSGDLDLYINQERSVGKKIVFNNAQGSFTFKAGSAYSTRVINSKRDIDTVQSTAGFYNAQDGNYVFASGSTTTFEKLKGIGIMSASGEAYFQLDGKLIFERIEADAQGNSFGILQANGSTMSFTGTERQIIFKNIQGTNATGVSFENNPISLSNVKLFFSNITAKDTATGLIGSDITLNKQSQIYLALNGAKSSYAFASSANKHTNLSLDQSLIALDFKSKNVKLFSSPNTLLNLTLKNGSRLILGSSNPGNSNLDLGVIDNLIVEGVFDPTSIHTDRTEALTNPKNNIIDLSISPIYDPNTGKVTAPDPLNAQKRSYYKTFTIGNKNGNASKGLQGNKLIFRLYADAKSADKIVVDKADLSRGEQQHYFQVNFARSDMPSLASEGFQNDIVLVQVKDEYKDRVRFLGLNSSSFINEANQVEILGGFSSFVVDIQNNHNDTQEYYQYYIPSGAKLLAKGLSGTYAQTGI